MAACALAQRVGKLGVVAQRAPPVLVTGRVGLCDVGPEADSGYCVSARLPLPAGG